MGPLQTPKGCLALIGSCFWHPKAAPWAWHGKGFRARPINGSTSTRGPSYLTRVSESRPTLVSSLRARREHAQHITAVASRQQVLHTVCLVVCTLPPTHSTLTGHHHLHFTAKETGIENGTDSPSSQGCLLSMSGPFTWAPAYQTVEGLACQARGTDRGSEVR